MLGISASALSKFESRSRRPTIELAAAVEVVFGRATREVFPGFYGEIERAVVERARRRRERYGARSDAPPSKKLRVLDDIIARASQTTLSI
jgi:transcriptional regulator with XRE-family HTH domain